MGLLLVLLMHYFNSTNKLRKSQQGPQSVQVPSTIGFHTGERCKSHKGTTGAQSAHMVLHRLKYRRSSYVYPLRALLIWKDTVDRLIYHFIALGS